MGERVKALRTRPRPKGAPPPSREDLLASIETVAAGPAKRKIGRARAADSARRAKAVKAMRPRYAQVKTTVAVLLTAAGVVLFLPDPLGAMFVHPVLTLTGEFHTYTVELYDAGLVVLAGGMLAAGAILHWLLERHRPRALPYVPGIFIPYLLFAIPAASGTVARWIDFDLPPPLTTLGVLLAAGATLAFAVLLVFSLRSPRALTAVWHGSEQARELDGLFRADVQQAIHENEHVRLDSYRAQALEGIRLLYADRLTDAEDALWMLREISPTAPADS